MIAGDPFDTGSFAGLPPSGRRDAIVLEARLLCRDAGERRRRGVMVAEGVHLAQEALRDPGRVRMALASPRLLRMGAGHEMARVLAAGPFPSRLVDDRLLASLAHVESHQGILLVVERPRWATPDLTSAPSPPLVLAACGVQDPGNLGALARIAEAAWASGLACAGAGADPWSARSVRASAGALMRFPVVEYPDPLTAAGSLRSLGLRLVGASPRSGTAYREDPLTGAMAIFVGSEGAGLPGDVRSALDAEVRIPVREGVESLNVAAAAAVILFEAASRRGFR